MRKILVADTEEKKIGNEFGLFPTESKDGVSLERGTSARPVEVSYDDIKDITILPEANLGNYGKTGEEIAKEKEGEAK